MSTKAQQFRAAQEQTHAAKTKVKKPKRVIDPQHTQTRNETVRGDKKVGMALEDSASGRPSRKSTRASLHHGRADTALMRTALAKSQTPKARAQRAQVERK